MISITKANDLPLKLGYFCLYDTVVTTHSYAFEQLEALGIRLQDTYKDLPINEIPGIHLGRELFHAIGIDPTKRRPSSEALLRRALKGTGFFSVNSHVDVANWCSLELLLPICVYDLATISPPISILLGTEEHHYLAINQRDMSFTSRPVLVDAYGAFGSPLTDSLRSALHPATKDILFCLWAPISLPDATLLSSLDLCAHRLKRIGGGTIRDELRIAR